MLPMLSERRMFMIAVMPESFASLKFSPTRKGIHEIAASGASSPARVANIRTDRRRRQAKQSLMCEGVSQSLPAQAEAARLVVVGQTERERHRPLHAR